MIADETTLATMKGRFGRWIVLALYLATLAGVTWGLVYARGQVLAEMSGTDASLQWVNDSQELAKKPGPVERRPSKSMEPPSLTLMRDHFAVVLIVCLLITSMLYGFLVVTIRGSLRGDHGAGVGDRG